MQMLYRIQAYDSIRCKCFCIRFGNFILNDGKTLLIYFQQTINIFKRVELKNYGIKRNKYRKFKNSET